MPSDLPRLTPEELAAALAVVSPEPLAPAVAEALYAHYLELARWNRTLSLIGPGTAEDFVVRHYGESLAALPWIPEEGELVDLGSGAGFPGLVIAAARPRLAVTLVEARQRKWAFLQAAARRAALPCRCLDARVGVPLPTGLPAAIDRVTVRALKLDAPVLGALAERLGPSGSMLLWAGDELPALPPMLAPARELKLPGSARRRIVELRRAADPGACSPTRASR
jgi:16S rRNA (guanine(527)-N(7))-methyltransferase RsmG